MWPKRYMCINILFAIHGLPWLHPGQWSGTNDGSKFWSTSFVYFRWSLLGQDASFMGHDFSDAFWKWSRFGIRISLFFWISAKKNKKQSSPTTHAILCLKIGPFRRVSTSTHVDIIVWTCKLFTPVTWIEPPGRHGRSRSVVPWEGLKPTNRLEFRNEKLMMYI